MSRVELFNAMLTAMGSTSSDGCLALHGHQGVAMINHQIKAKAFPMPHARHECRLRNIRISCQHLSQRSYKSARNVVCGYQRAAIAPPRGGTFPLPIDYTQVGI